ncbi:MAG TPA: portal protein [Alphaproteobacteria bacterium]|nr:portal protein [Alphaproteobacteria bacterium]
MKWDHEILQQSKSIGVAEAQMDSMYGLYYQQGQYMGIDIGQKEFIAFYDKEYPTRRDFLRKFAMNGEIEHVLEVIADETIIYDQSNYFGYPNTQDLKAVLKQDKAREIVDDLNEAFKKVYFAFGFNKGHDAWHYCKKFLIDGFLSFEIIYVGEDDEDAKNVIGFKEVDPVSLEPEIRKDEDGKEYRVWIQYRGDSERQRELLDSNLIYISWARGNFISRLSYVERLVRSFNMLRTLENSRIIWNVWNAQMRVKILVPIGTQSEAKARTRLSELRGMYKEELTIDDQSGEVNYNGQVQFPFAKQFLIPTREGVQTEIDGFQPQGYDLSNTEALNYFWMRFIIETKVPNSRFSNDPNGGGQSTWTSNAEGVQREEMRFENFINRIRAIFQEIILKPTWIQFAIKHPQLMDDEALRSVIGLDFNEENLFTMAKERDLAEKSAATITTLMGITQPTVNSDGTPGEENYFDPKFLVEKFMEMTEGEIKLNIKYKKERREQIRKLAAAYAKIMKARGGGEGMGAEGGGFGEEGGGFGGGGLGGGGGGGEFDFGGGGDLGGGGEFGEEGGDLGGGEFGAEGEFGAPGEEELDLDLGGEPEEEEEEEKK